MRDPQPAPRPPQQRPLRPPQSLDDLWRAIEREQEACGAWCARPGGCDASCCDFARLGSAPIVSARERERIEAYLRAAGRAVPPQEGTRCRFLTAGGRCSIYPVRPTGCRIFLCADGALAPLAIEPVQKLLLAYLAAHPDEVRSAEPLPIARLRA